MEASCGAMRVGYCALRDRAKKAGGLNMIVTTFRVSDVDVYGMVKGKLWIPQGETIPQ